MLKKCTRALFLLLLAVFLLPTIFGIGSQIYNVVYADTSSSGSSGSSVVDSDARRAGYIIQYYDIDIKVEENNVMHITETIDCKFTMASHGILRYIPISNTLKRADGTENTQLARISDFKANGVPYSESREGNMKVYKIGDPNKTIIGEQSYVLSYTYNLGEDGIDSYDELYFNIIGNKWDTRIKYISFEIEMPKEFDSTKIGFSKGVEGSSGYEDVAWTVNGNVISGQVSKGLPSYHGLTIRLELPENYFVGEESLASGYEVFAYVIPTLALIFGLIVYIIFKSRNRYVQAVEFYPPKGISSLDAALIYKGRVNNQDVISLIVQLASHGYIQIKESKGKPETIQILKTDYVGDNIREAEFLRLLSSYGTSVSFSSLRSESFPEKVSRIARKTNDKKNKGKYITGNLANIVLTICAAVAMLMPTIVGVGDFYDFDNIWISLIVVGMAIAACYACKDFKNNRSMAFVFVFIIAMMYVSFIYQQVAIFGIAYVIALGYGVAIFVLLQSISGKKVVSRTEKGIKLYGEILGFRQFIKTAEKDRLEMLCEENPEYFYDVLPYAYTLGVTDVWIKKFEDIAIPPADWYVSSSGRIFSIHDTTKVFSSASRASTPISSSSGSSGGGGFSGGGFSGGGSGGGGGGRW